MRLLGFRLRLFFSSAFETGRPFRIVLALQPVGFALCGGCLIGVEAFEAFGFRLSIGALTF